MPSTTRIIVAILGLYAALLGMGHGYFEILQGNVAPAGTAITAMGSPCQPELVFHACWPAMTLIPDFRLSGILAILVSIAVLVCSLVFVHHRYGRLALFLLAICLLLVGGGFLPPFYVMIAAAAATQIDSPKSWWQARLSGRTLRTVGSFWPWTIVVYLLWVVAQIVFGEALNATLIQLGAILMPAEISLLLLSVVAAFAQDIVNQSAALPSTSPSK